MIVIKPLSCVDIFHSHTNTIPQWGRHFTNYDWWQWAAPLSPHSFYIVLYNHWGVNMLKLYFRHCGGLHQTTLILWWYLLKSKANLLLRVVTIGCNCHQLSEKWGTMAPTTCGQLKSYFWPNFLQYNCPESSKIFQLPTVANSWSFCHFIFIPILIHPLLSVKVVIFWHLSSNKMKRSFFYFNSRCGDDSETRNKWLWW